MIRSMTGFGEARRDTPMGRLRLELKSVNHRFFNPNIKTPQGFDRYEGAMKDVLKSHISRGHVTAYLSIDRSVTEDGAVARVDLERAREIRTALETVRSELELPGEVDLATLARFGEIFRAPEPDESIELDVAVLRDMTSEAVQALVSLREAEGQRLHDDLLARVESMAASLDVIEARAPERLVRERDRLREAVRELSEQVEVDEDRLAREIAYVAERWDINEETVRFRSHISLFREALASDAAEAVGKRLGFLVQEMHREANTVGSKANDAEIAAAAMALKEEIERLREQVENVE